MLFCDRGGLRDPGTAEGPAPPAPSRKPGRSRGWLEPPTEVAATYYPTK